MTSAVRADRHSAGSLPYALTWENVSYSVPVNKTEMRMLLNKVSGSIQPGSVVAIMGSSGAGKPLHSSVNPAFQFPYAFFHDAFIVTRQIHLA